MGRLGCSALGDEAPSAVLMRQNETTERLPTGDGCGASHGPGEGVTRRVRIEIQQDDDCFLSSQV